jgi:hypothetical protein
MSDIGAVTMKKPYVHVYIDCCIIEIKGKFIDRMMLFLRDFHQRSSL